jgi:hypothetical protein
MLLEVSIAQTSVRHKNHTKFCTVCQPTKKVGGVKKEKVAKKKKKETLIICYLL